MKLLGSVCLKERYKLSITCKVSSLWLQVLVCLVYRFCLFGLHFFVKQEKRNDNSLLVVVCASSQQGQMAEYSMPFLFPHCPAVMPSPQRRKEKHMANIKFPSAKNKTRNSHRPTPDAMVHHPGGTPIMTRPHRTLKKKKFDG